MADESIQYDGTDYRLHAARLMTATAHLLLARPGMSARLNDRLAIMVGPQANPATLIHWADWVRRGGRPILLLSSHPDEILPSASLVCAVGDQMRVFEQCELWMRCDGARAYIIPSDFRHGAYFVGDDLKLRRVRQQLPRDLRAASDGVVRAWERLFTIVAEQGDDDIQLPPPVRLREAA